MDKEQVSLKHLFQQEFSKMVAVISKMYGLQHIEIAEDIVSDTFLLAAESWGMKGLPANPTAWLYAVAKQKTLYHFRRSKIFQEKVVPEIRTRQDTELPESLDFSTQHIKDSQLQMMFAVCNPAIASEAQIGLALRILCGFGIDEIADAFLTNKETINKRLFRAKERLRTEQVKMELPPEHQLTQRLDNVLHVVYLLFSEGYYSKTQDQVLRRELCFEAMRLGLMLTEYGATNQPKTNALMALMCFHASRFDARRTTGDELVLYDQQDEGLWDKELIKQGYHFLGLAAEGSEVSSYHLEAGIAYWHTVKEDSEEKWQQILQLYDKLLLINHSPEVSLNRVYAFYKVYGAKAALAEAEQLGMENSHFYFVLLGELYKNVDKGKAKSSFEKGYELARTQAEKQLIQAKLAGLQ